MEILVLQTSVADPWHFDLDPDLDPWIHFSDCPGQDPAIFVIELQDANKKTYKLKKNFMLFTFWRYMYSIFKNKKSKRSHKAVENKVFLTIFAWW